jgi:hypothetical protein
MNMALYSSNSDDIKDVAFDKSELAGIYPPCIKSCNSKGAYYHRYRNDFYPCNEMRSYYSNDGHYAVTGASQTPRWRNSPQPAEISREAKCRADGKMLTSKVRKKLPMRNGTGLSRQATLPEEEE